MNVNPSISLPTFYLPANPLRAVFILMPPQLDRNLPLWSKKEVKILHHFMDDRVTPNRFTTLPRDITEMIFKLFSDQIGFEQDYHSKDPMQSIDLNPVVIQLRKNNRIINSAIPKSQEQVLRPYGETALHDAVKRGDLSSVEFCVDHLKFNPDKPRVIDGMTPLMLAAYHGFLDIVIYLLTLPINVNAINKWHKTALFLAASRGHDSIVELLLSYQAKMDVSALTPLIIAVGRNHDSTVKLLLQAGAYTGINSMDRTLLHVAASKGDEVVGTLLKAGLKSTRDSEGRTPLHYAAHSDRCTSKMIECFKSDLESYNIHGDTPLLTAVNRRSIASVRALLAAGANPEAFNNQGICALGMALFVGCEEIIDALREAGATQTTILNPSPLSCLIVAGHEGLFKKTLFENRHLVNHQNARGSTSLHTAAQYRRPQMVRSLLEAGADPSLRTCLGNTPLNKALYHRDYETVDALIAPLSSREAFQKLGLDIHQPIHRDGGQLPLFEAATTGHTKLIRILLSFPDIDVNAYSTFTFEGFTTRGSALHAAALKGNVENLNLLIQAGANLHAVTENGYTPLSLAVLAHRKEIVQSLLAAGAKASHFAVSHAVKYDQLEIMRLLLPHARERFEEEVRFAAEGNQFSRILKLHSLGVSIDNPDSRGWTPLMFAARHGQLTAVHTLISLGADPLRVTPEGMPLSQLTLSSLPHADAIKNTLRQLEAQALQRVSRTPQEVSDAKRPRRKKQYE